MDDTIRDPLLLSVLSAAHRTREQCLSILDFLDSHAIKSNTPLPSAQSAAGAGVQSLDAVSPPREDQFTLSRQQKSLTSHLAQFRGLYRRAALEARATKQVTSEAKSEIDTLHLQLQNLLYEQRHLSGEIAACEDYNHSYKSLSLLPLETASQSTPSLLEVTDEHELMIARIKDEHSRRLKLETERQGLAKQKHALLLANKVKKEELDALDREIEKFVNGSGIVMRIFENKEKVLAEEQRLAEKSRVNDEAGEGVRDGATTNAKVTAVSDTTGALRSPDVKMEGT